MPAVMGAVLLVSIFVTVALAATTRDLNLTKTDLAHRQAYAAAQAAISEYAYNLNRDSNYWAKCTSVPAPNAVNQQNSTARRRPVPGNSGATYAIQLLPANGATACSTSNPVGTMIQASGPDQGTFRIRAIGFADDTQRSIVATFKRASFLDYVYFTQLETSDPITYAHPNWLQSAYTQCSKTIVEGRYNNSIPGSGGVDCDVISFTNGEEINGPLHTNDALVVCGRPVFGRTLADVIEVSAPPRGWYSTNQLGGSCSGGGNPDFVGTFITNAPVLTPPPTNQKLAEIAGLKYSGQVRICLSGNNMTVGTSPTSATCPSNLYSGAVPSNGLVYVANSSTTPCTTTYSPYTASYPATSGCGNVYVKNQSSTGTFSSQLTIAAENDIIIDGNLRQTGSGMLGLIANNFVRVYHPYRNQEKQRDCSGGDNGPDLPGSYSPSRIDAAILAIDNSFIVDHYDCGSSLGTLTVNGAISQKFRGPVGTFSGSTTVSGYRKNYNYDDRLRSISPPHFLDPLQSAWHVGRQTLDFPN